MLIMHIPIILVRTNLKSKVVCIDYTYLTTFQWALHHVSNLKRLEVVKFKAVKQIIYTITVECVNRKMPITMRDTVQKEKLYIMVLKNNMLISYKRTNSLQLLEVESEMEFTSPSILKKQKIQQYISTKTKNLWQLSVRQRCKMQQQTSTLHGQIIKILYKPVFLILKEQELQKFMILMNDFIKCFCPLYYQLYLIYIFEQKQYLFDIYFLAMGIFMCVNRSKYQVHSSCALDKQSFKSNKYMFSTIQDHPKWECQIRKVLIEIQDGKKTIRQIIETLNHFRKTISPQRQNPRLSSYQPTKFRFQILQKLYRQETLIQLFKDIAYIIIKTKDVKIPIFSCVHKDIQCVIPKSSIFYIICCMFMCLIPDQQFQHSKEVKNFNYLTHFSHVLSDCQFKTRSIVQYIQLEINRIIQNKSLQNLTIVRKYTRQKAKQLIYTKHKDKVMKKIDIQSDKNNIQQYFGDIKISFANRLIGGGALKNGSVQQQIMFACHPEMYAAMILCSSMKDQQALCFKGFKKYFQLQGYKDKVKFIGKEPHSYLIDENHEIQQYIVSIDAYDFDRQQQKQYQEDFIDRQIVKAYTGFVCIKENKPIVTGNWGCGVFKGNVQLKLIIQCIAASLAGKNILYCPYGSEKNLNHERLNDMKGQKIQDVYYDLIHAAKKYGRIIRQNRRQRGSFKSFFTRETSFFDVFFGDKILQ